jgi:hypothetical protein
MRIGRPRDAIFIEASAKGNNGQNEAAEIIVYNNSNQK